MLLGVRGISIVVCLVQLHFPDAESSLGSDVTSVKGKTVLKFLHHGGKTRTSNDSILLLISSSIYNGMVPLSMNKVYVPFTYRNNITGASSTVHETFSCYYKAQEVVYGTVSLCFGIKGYLRFSTFGIHIETQKPLDENFFSKLDVNSSHDVNIIHEEYQDYRYHNRRRFKRETKKIRFSASTPIVVKLYIAIHSSLIKKLGLQQSKDRVINIMNIVNGAYHDLGIVFAIVGFRTYTERILYQTSILIDNLQSVKREDPAIREADCFHLIAHEVVKGYFHYFNKPFSVALSNDFYKVGNGERYGKGTNEKMCSVDACVGYSFDDTAKSERHTALIVAHELGHNFGVPHDQQDTDCQSCIMSPLINFDKMKLSWSRKSHETIKDVMEQGLDKCLKDDNTKPKKIAVGMSSCGNGIVEEGEECDCGSVSSCSRNKCCDGRSCQLSRGAKCANGDCCDISVCQFKDRSTSCRPAAGKCDLPEFCTGETEFCPNDVYHLNGRPCDNEGQAYCVNGTCESSHSRCQALWGHTARVGKDKCFDKNLETHNYGHCKQNSLTRIPYRKDKYPFGPNKRVTPCGRRDKMCGRLWCDHKNIKPMIYGVLGVFNFYVSGDSLCAGAVVDLGVNVREYGLVPNGAKCGEDKMCYDSKCISVKNLHVEFNCTCNYRGVCNSQGNCHCNYGFKPPDCVNQGTGGSIDSGPPPEKWQSLPPVVVVLIILTILFIAVIGFVALVCVKKRHKLAQMKFRYRSVPSSKPPPAVTYDVEPKNTSNGTVSTNAKVNTNNKFISPSKSETLNGPPPRPPPKPDSLKIIVKPDNQPVPSPDTPPLPPYPNEYAIPNGQLSEDTDKTKTRPKISSPIFQTSTNTDLGNIPHVETTVKKNATSKNHSSLPMHVTSRNPSSAPKPGTSGDHSSPPRPGTSGNHSTVPKSGASRNPSTVPKPGASRNPSTPPKPGTSKNPSSTPKPGTSKNPSSTPKPGTSRNQSPLSKPGTSGNPSSAPKPETFRNQAFVPKSGTPRNPSFVPTPPRPPPASNHQPPPPPPPSYTKPSLPPAKKPIFRP